MLSAATVRLISTSLVSPLEMVRTQTQALGRHQRTWTWYAGLSRARGPSGGGRRAACGLMEGVFEFRCFGRGT